VPRLAPSLLVALALAGIAASALGQAPTPAEERGAPVDFALEETSGTTRTLHEARGRIIVLFFENREHTEDNRDLKLTLHRFLVDNHLEDQVRVYAVADVHSIPGLMRDVARAAIRGIADQYGIQILLDWDGALLAPPFRMSETAANVALLDREGRIAWRHTGAFGEADDTAFFRAFRRLLRE